ncbi:MAG: exonuclease SbcCD subunit D C-terminal domain-containing protein, partial [Clostridia bacterium]|nr:exonuclease SbcCD subunit D C-terminal domain-containing protein [Clostridia bacterium]
NSDSEELIIGSLEEIEAEIFAAFDYVALGHLHRPQTVTVSPNGQPKIRYCGSPLQYSISEGAKSLTLLDLRAKGQLDSQIIPLHPLREVRHLKGSYAELTQPTCHSDDFVQITLTDENDIFAALDKLRTIYPHILKLEYDNQRTRHQHTINAPLPSFKPLELFSHFFELQNNQALSPEQENYLVQLIQEIEEN